MRELAREHIITALFVVGLGIVVSLSFFSSQLPPLAASSYNEEVEELPRKIDENKVLVTAEAAIVYDIKNDEILYRKNMHKQVPLASVTKVMTAIVAQEQFSEDDKITVTLDAIEQEGDSGLFANEAWYAKHLAQLVLISSSNDGAKALSQALSTRGENFVDVMNAKAQELGLTQTYFLNESGLDVSETVSGGYGSAYDTAQLLGYALSHHYELFVPTQYEEATFYSLNYGEHRLSNTNKDVRSIPSLLVSKTGFTDLAGGNLGIVFEKEPNHPIAVVVLGSTQDDRFTDVEKLVWETISL